jgi:hypothetical protein
MDKKIVIPAGLAVLVVMAVVGMLSIFNFTSPNVVEASLENPTITTNNNIGTFAATDQVTSITISANPSLVGDISRLTITFVTTGAGHNNEANTGGVGDLPAGTGEISIRFDSSKFVVPSTIGVSDVTIATSTTNYTAPADVPEVVHPNSVTVSSTGAESDLQVITLVVPDMDPSVNTGANGIGSAATVTINILQSAGVQLPVKAGSYNVSIWNNNDTDTTSWSEGLAHNDLVMTRDVTLSAVSGSRGDTVTATASGYSSGTATFWNDDEGDGTYASDEQKLCSGDVSSSTATCDFTVGVPPFLLGKGTGATTSG